MRGQKTYDGDLITDITEAEETVMEFRLMNQEAEMIPYYNTKLSQEQKKIFKSVTSFLMSSEGILRHFVSGAGGTGKSVLVKVIKSWVKTVLKKDVAVLAPTGISAFNVEGMTINTIFKLPVKPRDYVHYEYLNNEVLIYMREQLKNVALFIIDEVSMISNVMFWLIHLRLSELFGTLEKDEGWFGKKHMLLFGDLLQLPPTSGEFAFVEMDKEKNYLSYTNLWKDLFTYDELLSTVRHRKDKQYAEILYRLRVGTVEDEDLELLRKREIVFKSSRSQRLQIMELCRHMTTSNSYKVCLLPTMEMRDIINGAFLSGIPTGEIHLDARDTLYASPNRYHNAQNMLTELEDDICLITGLEKRVTVKLGSRVMLRKNLDVLKGLVNGTIGKVVKIPNSRGDEIDTITVNFNDIVKDIERVVRRVTISDHVFVERRQFPIHLAYGITIRQSQGLSLESAVMDLGSSPIANGLSYAALSKVPTMGDVYLMYLDPEYLTVNQKSEGEYKRLREIHEANLKHQRSSDNNWSVKSVENTASNGNDFLSVRGELPLNAPQELICGFENNDRVSCYANATLQCLLREQLIRDRLKNKECDSELGKLTIQYENGEGILQSLKARKYAGTEFENRRQQDASEFLDALATRSAALRSVVQHKVKTTTRCKTCKKSRMQQNFQNILFVPTMDTKTTIHEMLEQLGQWNDAEGACPKCSDKNLESKSEIVFANDVFAIVCLVFKDVEGRFGKKDIHINNLPKATIYVKEDAYKFSSAIFHYGDDIEQGHYTAIFKINHQYQVADDTLVEPCTWPVGAQNLYIIFFTKK